MSWLARIDKQPVTTPAAPDSPTSLEQLAQALTEVAELARAGLSGAQMWQPIIGTGNSHQARGLEAWADQVSQTEVEVYAKATCGIERFAAAAGASVGDLLDGLVTSIQGHLETAEAFEGAIAGPRASARLLQFLPLVGPGLGALMGVNVLAVLLGGGLGSLALVLGLGLLLLGRGWSKALLRKATARIDVEGLVALDLLAASLQAGLPIPAALMATAQAWPGSVGQQLGAAAKALSTGQDWTKAWEKVRSDQVLVGIERALGLSWRCGVSCSGLLAAVKSSVLRAERLRGVKAAARLGVSLMAPLGLCYLPSFVALGLAPVVISLASGLTLLG
ncbi:MAG: hypothetical protein FWG16_04825 [Micrococcales bacterium]|nr:hypothetical protein [Micrococcales bacterium]